MIHDVFNKMYTETAKIFRLNRIVNSQIKYKI
jgi:hypothetical protein